MLALALVGLAQSGCKSDGCNTCGGFFSRAATNVGNGVQSLGSRVFHHGGGGGGCSTCDGGESVGIIDSGVPIVAPGGMIVPGPATIAPAPALEAPPSQLEPIPSTSTQPAGAGPAGSSRALPANNRSAYETSSPRGLTARGRSRIGEVARAHLARPEAVPPPAELVGESSDVLDRVPPVDLPSDFSRKASATPAPSTPKAPVSPAAEEHSAAGAGDAPLSAALVVAPKQAPGIRRSAYVAPSIGGGSAPTLEGLGWLKEKGYKTFIDLRHHSEVEASYIDSVNDLGMVYISLPIVSDRLSAPRMARFEDMISQSSVRPLFFCDTDGTRAGLVWYLHLRSVVGEDGESAAQKAEELGLDAPTRKLADAFLTVGKRQAAVAPNRDLALREGSNARAIPNLSPPDVAVPSTVPTATPPVIPTPEPPLTLPDDSPPAPMFPSEVRPQASATPSPEGSREPSSWKAVAAFVLTGLGVPLAYWSKTAIGGSRVIRRASLPAAARRSLRGPAGSDA